MEAKDLMDGNYIYLSKDGFKTQKTYQLDPFDIYKISESGGEDCRPIPLTEEWLLDFGYIKKETTLTQNYTSPCQSLWIYMMPNGKFFASGAVHDIYLPYVHTLQNTHKVFTTEQLELKVLKENVNP